MEEKKKKKLAIIVGIIIVVIVLLIAILSLCNKPNNVEVRQIKLGDIVALTDDDKQLLRNETIKNVSNYLKAPSTAQFEEEFEYVCKEANIVEVKGYVDSQNSFGAMLRGKFTCQFFAAGTDISIPVLLKYNDEEVFNIKEMYIEEYKKQKKLEDIQSSGNDLNQEKLEYIKEEFNSDKINSMAKITNVVFNQDKSIIDVQITADSSGLENISRNYWIDFTICSIMDYIKEFNVIGTVNVKFEDKDKNVEITFDDNFIKNTWKENQQINLVSQLFGEKYKET